MAKLEASVLVPCARRGLVNWYDGGKHSMGFHSDDERGLVAAAPIFAISWGCTRRSPQGPGLSNIPTAPNKKQWLGGERSLGVPFISVLSKDPSFQQTIKHAGDLGVDHFFWSSRATRRF